MARGHERSASFFKSSTTWNSGRATVKNQIKAILRCFASEKTDVEHGNREQAKAIELTMR